MAEKKVVAERIIQVLKIDQEFKDKWDDLVKIEGINDFLKSFSILFWLTKKVVFSVEYVQSELNQIEKDERIDVAVIIVDELIQFRGWARIFEPFDGLVYKIIISSAVQYLNDFFSRGSWHVIADAVKSVASGNLLDDLKEKFLPTT